MAVTTKLDLEKYPEIKIIDNYDELYMSKWYAVQSNDSDPYHLVLFFLIYTKNTGKTTVLFEDKEKGEIHIYDFFTKENGRKIIDFGGNFILFYHASSSKYHSKKCMSGPRKTTDLYYKMVNDDNNIPDDKRCSICARLDLPRKMFVKFMTKEEKKKERIERVIEEQKSNIINMPKKKEEALSVEKEPLEAKKDSDASFYTTKPIAQLISETISNNKINTVVIIYGSNKYHPFIKEIMPKISDSCVEIYYIRSNNEKLVFKGFKDEPNFHYLFFSKTRASAKEPPVQFMFSQINIAAKRDLTIMILGNTTNEELVKCAKDISFIIPYQRIYYHTSQSTDNHKKIEDCILKKLE